MFYFCTDKSEPIAHATLEAAIKTLRAELRAYQAQGYDVTFNDALEFQLSRSSTRGGMNGEPRRFWVQDEAGQHVTSKDAAEAG